MGRVYHRKRRGKEEATIQRGEGGDENVILHRIVSYYVYIYIISFVDCIWHIVLYHISCFTKISRVSYHFRAYHIILEHVQLYCIISCNIMPDHIMFAWYMYVSHSISDYMSLYCTVLYCIVLYCIELCCNKSCYVRMLYDIISLAYNMCLGHNIISCYIISNNVVQPYCIIMK